LPPPPHILGLFERRIAGDDALLELARLRFQRAGLGAEMHGQNPDQLEQLLKFRPSGETAVFVHLSRVLNLAEEKSREQIIQFATRFEGRVRGLVVHDRPAMASRPEVFLQGARALDQRLSVLAHSPVVFIEYAAGLPVETFAAFFSSIGDLVQVSPCLDIGHVGIQQARNAYSILHPGADICSLRSQASKRVLPDIQNAVATALPVVLKLIEDLGTFRKPVHFHLHDGHPLSTFSPFGVSDHLSFQLEIPLSFEYAGRRAVPLMFGPAGLAQVVAKAIEAVGHERLSLTLEIHPTFERLPLGDAAGLFTHWHDLTHAEQMNHWLSVLAQNHDLILKTLSPA
jgi:hypothetical protein